MVIACTGFSKPHGPFSTELSKDLGLSYDDTESTRWAYLDQEADRIVNELLPVLKDNPLREQLGPAAAKVRLDGPTRHYRAILPLKLAKQNDRSICFLGQIHSIFTPTTNELSALWAAAYMLGKLKLPSVDDMELEVATFHAWERKRYLEMGAKNSYCILDFLSVSTPSQSTRRV